MAALRDEIRRLWTEAFPADPQEWVESFFLRGYSDNDVVALRTAKGDLASMLLLQPYTLRFHGHDARMSYMCGVATRRRLRGRGLMSSLGGEALCESRERGAVFCALIPADSRLQLYYRRFGFRPSFPAWADRYTSLHPFSPLSAMAGDGPFFAAGDPYDEAVYDGFRELELSRPCRVLHTRSDYVNQLDDLRLDGGYAAAVADGQGAIAAMAWGVERDGIVGVKDLLATGEGAAQAALARLRDHWPDKPFTVLRPATRGIEGCRPVSRGMMRIVNAHECLGMIASAHPALRLTVRVTDPIVAHNNATLRLADGHAEQVSGPLQRRPDLDVDVATLTTLVFATEPVGEVTGLPSVTPEMALMMD